MKTLPFKSYDAFLNRLDKTINGVSYEFAKANPNYKKDNDSNMGCWECVNTSFSIDCIRCNNCNQCVRCTFSDGLEGKKDWGDNEVKFEYV